MPTSDKVIPKSYAAEQKSCDFEVEVLGSIPTNG